MSLALYLLNGQRLLPFTSTSITFLSLCFAHIHSFFFEYISYSFSVTAQYLTPSSSTRFLFFVLCKNTIQKSSNTCLKYFKHKWQKHVSWSTMKSYLHFVCLEFRNNRHLGVKSLSKRYKNVISCHCFFFYLKNSDYFQ